MWAPLITKKLLVFWCVLPMVVVTLLETPSKSFPELDWWQKNVVYQIYPRSFLDTNGDGTGDLKGIEAKLDHFTDMGVNIFWISPIYTSPMKDSGYDISNYTDIDPLFGNMDDFKSLVASAKSRGLYVVLDFVPNHSSDEHEWFIKSCQSEGNYTDYYVWANGTGPNGTDPPNNWLSNFNGPAWTYNETRGQFYYHAFLDSQPDLNYRDPNVRREMLNVLKFWLDLGVDGFRVDAIMYLFEDQELRNEPPSNKTGVSPSDYDYLEHIYTTEYPGTFDVIREWRALLNSYEKKDSHHRLMMVEVYDTLNETMRYYGNDSFPLADFPFNFQLIQLSKISTGLDVYELVSSWLNALPSGCWSNWVLGNHDNHRIANRTHVELVDGFNMINLLLGGTPVTYYGEEIGMVDVFIPYNETQDTKALQMGPDEYWKSSRDFERTPMQWSNATFAGFTTGERPWLRVGPNYPTTNVQVENTDPSSHYSIYKKLVSLHNETTVMNGDLIFPVVNDRIFSFAKVLRGYPGYIVVMNLGKTSVRVDFVDSGCCSTFRFPDEGTVIVESGIGTSNATVSLNGVSLGPRQSAVIQFSPQFLDA